MTAHPQPSNPNRTDVLYKSDHLYRGQIIKPKEEEADEEDEDEEEEESSSS